MAEREDLAYPSLSTDEILAGVKEAPPSAPSHKDDDLGALLGIDPSTASPASSPAGLPQNQLWQWRQLFAYMTTPLPPGLATVVESTVAPLDIFTPYRPVFFETHDPERGVYTVGPFGVARDPQWQPPSSLLGGLAKWGQYAAEAAATNVAGEVLGSLLRRGAHWALGRWPLKSRIPDAPIGTEPGSPTYKQVTEWAREGGVALGTHDMVPGRGPLEFLKVAGATPPTAKIVDQFIDRQRQELVRWAEKVGDNLGRVRPISDRYELGRAIQQMIGDVRAQMYRTAKLLYERFDAVAPPDPFFSPLLAEYINKIMPLTGDEAERFVGSAAGPIYKAIADLMAVSNKGFNVDFRKTGHLVTTIPALREAQRRINDAISRSTHETGRHFLKEFSQVIDEEIRHRLHLLAKAGYPEALQAFDDAQKYWARNYGPLFGSESTAYGRLLMEERPEKVVGDVFSPNNVDRLLAVMRMADQHPEVKKLIRRSFWEDIIARSHDGGIFSPAKFSRIWDEMKQNRTFLTEMLGHGALDHIDRFAAVTRRIADSGLHHDPGFVRVGEVGQVAQRGMQIIAHSLRGLIPGLVAGGTAAGASFAAGTGPSGAAVVGALTGVGYLKMLNFIAYMLTDPERARILAEGIEAVGTRYPTKRHARMATRLAAEIIRFNVVPDLPQDALDAFKGIATPGESEHLLLGPALTEEGQATPSLPLPSPPPEASAPPPAVTTPSGAISDIERFFAEY